MVQNNTKTWGDLGLLVTSYFLVQPDKRNSYYDEITPHHFIILSFSGKNIQWLSSYPANMFSFFK